MRRPRLGSAAFILLVAACFGGDETQVGTNTTTTTAVVVPRTTTTAATVPTTTQPTTTPTIPEYQIIDRIVGEDGAGDTVVVLLGQGRYTSTDLENVIVDVVERFAPVATAFLLDLEEAARLVTSEELTPEQQSLVDEHLFLQLVEGSRVIFLGPFADEGEFILGS